MVLEVILITIVAFAALIYLMLFFAKRAGQSECPEEGCSGCGSKHSCTTGQALLHGSPDEPEKPTAAKKD